ncbi:hypothetical protein BCS93_03490 [Vibrio breoganii]|uniref:Uncharacterized protein n=1 Tax=Vibrio breoganii TaxID=553239 RepID=A0AAP8MV13_9VIBR|nr:hypothetical protein BCS94_01235 [Vibrio breoganii]PMP08445.1 hypothetical protein BCS93_03490 [Vibrio breoganii]
MSPSRHLIWVLKKLGATLLSKLFDDERGVLRLDAFLEESEVEVGYWLFLSLTMNPMMVVSTMTLLNTLVSIASTYKDTLPPCV